MSHTSYSQFSADGFKDGMKGNPKSPPQLHPVYDSEYFEGYEKGEKFTKSNVNLIYIRDSCPNCGADMPGLKCPSCGTDWKWFDEELSIHAPAR